jgi:predicted transcriptional regulator
MRKITLNDDLKAKLGDLNDEIALCDAAGNVVACVVPPGHREVLHDMAAALFDDAEPVDGLRQYKAGRFKTTAEVLAHLRSLETREEQRA